MEHPDRAIRHAAEQARWAFFAEHGKTLDTLFGRLVELRTDMARTLGFETYTPLGYRRLRRVDYNPEEVARFREEVVTHVTPLVASLLEQRREEMGWPTLHYWDESFVDRSFPFRSSLKRPQEQVPWWASQQSPRETAIPAENIPAEPPTLREEGT